MKKPFLLKEFITETMISMGKNYQYKEALMKAVQSQLLNQQFDEQNSYSNALDNAIATVQSEYATKIPVEDLESTLDMIKNTLSGVPWQVARQLQ